MKSKLAYGVNTEIEPDVREYIPIDHRATYATVRVMTDDDIFSELVDLYVRISRLSYEDHVRGYVDSRLSLKRMLNLGSVAEVPDTSAVAQEFLIIEESKLYNRLCRHKYGVRLDNLDRIVDFNPTITSIEGCEVNYTFGTVGQITLSGAVILRRVT